MKLTSLETVKRTVFINTPQSGDGYRREKMTVEYNVLDQDEINELLELNDDQQTLDRVWAGFSGVRDVDGSDLEDNEENRRRLSRMPWIRVGIIRAFFEMSSGGKRKN